MASLLWHHQPRLGKFCGNTVIKNIVADNIDCEITLEAINYRDRIIDPF